MEVTVREISETMAEVTIERPVEDVRKEFEKHYQELQKDMQLPGFRKGKVPRSLLRQRFGRQIQAELANEMAGESLEEALGKQKLRAIGEPHVESLNIAEGEPFKLVVRIEHLPELRLKRYKGIAPPAPEFEVSDEELDKQLRLLQLRTAEHIDVERPAQRGDGVDGKFRLFLNDVLDGASEELDKPFKLVIGEDQLFTGTKLDEKLIGHSVGERFRIEGETPLAYPVERLRAKRVALDIELGKIQELKLPELTEEFAQEHFKKGLAELREDLKTQVIERKRKDDRESRLEVVFDKLREENPFPIPESLLRSEAHREEEQWEQYKLSEAERNELRRTQPARIERKVRNALLLQKVIELERFDVSDAEVQRRYQMMAPLFGDNPEAVQQLYQNSARLQRGLKDDMLQTKALDFLLESTPSLIVEV